MNRLTELYLLAGKPVLAPDAEVEMSFSDIDSADAGRDESGYMHRSVVRRKVGVWNFTYSHLTTQEYGYMLSVLPQAGSFAFTYPDPVTGESRVTEAYLSNYSVLWQDQKTGLYKNLKFSVIEC